MATSFWLDLFTYQTWTEFLIAPSERRSKVIAEVNRPTFASLSPSMSEVFRFISFESLRGRLDAANPIPQARVPGRPLRSN
jgi:hypothetical protein